MVEKRGKREDADLELEFRRVCDGGNYKAEQLPFEVAFVDKKSNSAGLQIADCRLQIADLVARPVGMSILRPDQPNRATDVLQTKFYKSHAGKMGGWGLKCFP